MDRVIVLTVIVSVVSGLVLGTMRHAYLAGDPESARTARKGGRHRVTRTPLIPALYGDFRAGIQVIACWLMAAMPRTYVMGV